MDTAPAPEALAPTGRGTELATDAPGRTLEWVDAERLLNNDAFCWLATVRPDGAPHVMPVLAVWSDSAVFVASKHTTRKSRNLEADGRCVVSTDTDNVHLVVEGIAHRVRDAETLQLASRAFEAVYGWPTTVDAEQLDASGGAPTSGGPPYRVYEIRPTTVFGLPADGGFMPTRWRLDGQ